MEGIGKIDLGAHEYIEFQKIEIPATTTGQRITVTAQVKSEYKRMLGMFFFFKNGSVVDALSIASVYIDSIPAFEDLHFAIGEKTAYLSYEEAALKVERETNKNTIKVDFTNNTGASHDALYLYLIVVKK